MKNGEWLMCSIMLKRLNAEAPALLVIIAFFTLFFWPGIFGGHYYVSGDALVYSYPMRKVAWEMIRSGTLPLWTPHILSGYPLLSMAQLGIGYPLTWFYLILPGHVAEHIYVLAPYVLAPIFVYTYLREIGRSRLASLLGGLSFTYGGMMVSGLGQTAMFTNAVMWLPLMLIAMERARTEVFARCLIGAGLAYAMAVLTGLGQGFLYAGIIAIAYGAFLSLFHTAGRTEVHPTLFSLQRWKPLAVAVGGIGLAVCVAAFQILETMQAQRLSIRRTLTYEIFSGGSFAPLQAWQSFINPIYHFNYEATAYVPLLAAVFALVAIIAALFSPRLHARTFFWLAVATFGLLLMMGDHTPLYRLAYRVPLLNLFRIPWRHAYEWTLAVSVLSAFGWDAAANLTARATQARREKLIAGGMLAACLAAGIVLLKLANRPVDTGSTSWATGLSESALLGGKLGYTLLLMLAVWFGFRMMQSRWRLMLLVTVIVMACYWEQELLGPNWWTPQNKTASFFNSISPPSRFLKNYVPEQNRIYTSWGNGLFIELPRYESHNLAARHGLHDAAGYEPLMMKRYNLAFGAGWAFETPSFSAPLDHQILNPRWQALDLLNVRHLVEFNAPVSASMIKDGIKFAVPEATANLTTGQSLVFTGAPASVDSLSLVTTMANSTHLEQGQPVARIIVHTADGRAIERELKAGIDTAEWAHERPDVKQNIRHALPPIFDSRPADTENSFSALRYQTKLDLGEKAIVERIEVKNVAEIATVILWKATLYDSAGNDAFLLRQRLPEHWRKVYDADNVAIYENPRALPRCWLAPQAKAVSEEEALRAIRGESEEAFNPRELALIEPDDKVKVELPQENNLDNALANIIIYQPNRLAIETNTNNRAVLVVSEVNYPGWEATIDGQPTTIFKTDYLLRGVIVPAGKHRVEMRYTAPAAKIGAMISALTLLLLGGMAIFAARRKRSASVPRAGNSSIARFMLHGAIQHAFYHARQIALLKKLVA